MSAAGKGSEVTLEEISKRNVTDEEMAAMRAAVAARRKDLADFSGKVVESIECEFVESVHLSAHFPNPIYPDPEQHWWEEGSYLVIMGITFTDGSKLNLKGTGTELCEMVLATVEGEPSEYISVKRKMPCK